MNHLKGFRKLNRTHSHRRALYKNMATALLKNEKIQTTLIKAKEIRRVVEKIITRAKVKNLHNIRIVNKLIKDKDVLMKLFNEIAPRYVNRNGGYTRIIKLPKMRAGDGSAMAYIELIEEVAATKKKKKAAKDSSVQSKKTEEVKQQPETNNENVVKNEATSSITEIKDESKKDEPKE